MSQSPAPPPRMAPLFKTRSWSPDMLRDQAWSRRKGHHMLRRSGRLSRSVTDDDLDELKACFELGFGFDSPAVDPKLANAFPALELYHTVNRQYSQSLSRTASSSSTVVSDSDTSSFSVDRPSGTIFDAGDDPEMVKTRIRQWAQVVACVARQSPN